MEIKRRMTKQRAVIYDYIKTHRTHPTANEVHTALSQHYPEMSLATVYRNLNLLAETGMLLKITMPSAPDRFDGDIHPHYHFLCTECGKVDDIHIPYEDALDLSAKAHCPHQINEHEVYFKGTCEDCLKEKSEE